MEKKRKREGLAEKAAGNHACFTPRCVRSGGWMGGGEMRCHGVGVGLLPFPFA